MRRTIVLALALMGLAAMGAVPTADAADAGKPPELHAYPGGGSDKAGPTYRIRRGSPRDPTGLSVIRSRA